MNFDDLMEKLRKTGVTISPSTVRRWAQAGIISAPARRHRQKGEGRGKISDWSQQSLEEIAGCWAVRHYGFREFGVLNRNYEDSVRFAKNLAEYFYADPIGWELHRKQALYDQFYSRDEFDDLSKALGERLHEADFRNLIEWVAAVEKIRRGRQLSERVYCDFVFLYDGTLKDRTLQYQFFGVRLETVKELMQSEIRVIIHRRDVFAKAARKMKEETRKAGAE